MFISLLEWARYKIFLYIVYIDRASSSRCTRSPFPRFTQFPTATFLLSFRHSYDFVYVCVYLCENKRLRKHVKIVNCVLIISFRIYLFIYFNFYWYVCTLSDMCYKDTRHIVCAPLIPFHFLHKFSSLCRLVWKIRFVAVLVVDFSHFIWVHFIYRLFSVCAYGH